MSDPQAALGGGQPAIISSLSEQDLLDVAARVLPSEYVDPLRANGPGYEVLRAGAQVMARASLALARLDAGLYFTSAAGASFSTGHVVFTVATAATFGRDIKAGTIVRAPRGGQRYVVTADARISAFSTDPIVASVRAVAPGWEYDVRGQRTTAAGETLPGEISEMDLVLLDPPASAPDLQVHQEADVTGGAAPMLDMLAEDHDVSRQTGEADPALASRARAIPEVVTPNAIATLVARYLGPRGIPYQIVQWWQFRWGLAWDVAPTSGTGKNPADSVTPADTWFWDDPRIKTDKIWRNRWRCPTDQGAVVIAMPSLPAARSHAFLWDDPGVTRDDHRTASGRYAFGAWDFDHLVHPLLSAPCWDGPDLGVRDVLRELRHQLVEAMPGGYNVFFALLPGAADPHVLAAIKAAALAADPTGASTPI